MSEANIRVIPAYRVRNISWWRGSNWSNTYTQTPITVNLRRRQRRIVLRKKTKFVRNEDVDIAAPAAIHQHGWDVDLSQWSWSWLLQHPLYSPGLAPSDFWVFPHFKKCLRRYRFSSNEVVITVVNGYFAHLPQKNLQERNPLIRQSLEYV